MQLHNGAQKNLKPVNAGILMLLEYLEKFSICQNRRKTAFLI